MTNHQSGHDAERVAAEYLKEHGFNIVELNWKTRLCEIDIVAEKDKRIYFVEVKSRKTLFQGMGFDYVTTKKLSQMKFAAEMWVSEHKWQHDYQLAAVSIDSGAITFLDSLT